MRIGLYVAVISVLAFIAFVCLVLEGIQVYGRYRIRKAITAIPVDTVSDADKTCALAYFDKCAGIAGFWRAVFDHLRAPFVMFFVLWGLPVSADDLPERWAYWRNNVGINGDGWAWYQSETGQWKQCYEGNAPDGQTAVSYSDPAYTGDAYYAKGHHPRSFYARWIWLGFRNVATKRMVDIGPLCTCRPTLLYSWITDRGDYQVLYAITDNGRDGGDTCYGWSSYQKRGRFAVWAKAGAKLGIVSNAPQSAFPVRAMITNTPLAFKNWNPDLPTK